MPRNNQTPCFAAFGCDEESRHRLRQFIEEAARWEDVPPPALRTIEPGLEAADVGRFHFVRNGQVIRLNIDVDGRLYRQMLEVNVNRDAWDWAEEE